MRFKYRKEIASIPDCPPDHYENRILIVYRFVFEDISDERNFSPVLILKPKRIHARMFRRDEAKCQGYGLSLFNTLENAQRKYLKLIKNRPKLAKKLGTHIAQGLIEESDGVVSPINREGHLTLHESEQADLKRKFRLVMEVYNDGKPDRK